jgi:hypothetical protein
VREKIKAVSTYSINTELIKYAFQHFKVSFLNLRDEVPMVVKMSIIVLWVVKLCGLVSDYQCFGEM